MLGCRQVNPPMADNKALEDEKAEKSKSNSEPTQFWSREAVSSSLIYLIIGTCLHLFFAAANLNQFCETPAAAHWIAVKRVIQYVNGTCYMKIFFPGLTSWMHVDAVIQTALVVLGTVDPQLNISSWGLAEPLSGLLVSRVLLALARVKWGTSA